jgi:predicted RNase H-like nuclease
MKFDYKNIFAYSYRDSYQMAEDRYMGVDGCKAGWFFVSIGPGEDAEFGIIENIERLFNAYSDARSILIDIPIGLPFEGKPSRNCDTQARQALKPKRRNSVFSPPCREALAASSYDEACRINQKITGRKITIFAYHLIPKIREVDSLMQKNPKALSIIRESHPEICFWALAGCNPMEHYKKTPQGLRERLGLLKKQFPRASAIYKAALDRYLRKEVGRDDILDALAVAITALRRKDNGASLPPYADKDALGLPMQMVYAKPEDPSVPDITKSQNMPDAIVDLIRLSGVEQRVFPATEYFNETWMLRIVLDWFSKHQLKDHPLSFARGCRWFSEGLIPTQFLPRSRKDPLGESWTHADGIIGHVDVGAGGRADVRLTQTASHLSCVEAKMFSKLSAGVKNARYFNQCARYIACMAELLHRADRRPQKMEGLAFFIFAPQEQIDAGVFSTQSDPDHINETVKRRVSEYHGEKDSWYHQWFLATLKSVDIQCLGWESIADTILKNDPYYGNQIQTFYFRCLQYNRPLRHNGL